MEQWIRAMKETLVAEIPFVRHTHKQGSQQVTNAKLAKKRGTLVVTNARLVWRADDVPLEAGWLPDVNVPFSEYKGQMVNKDEANPKLKVSLLSPPDASYMFTFNSVDERDQVKNAILVHAGKSVQSQPQGAVARSPASTENDQDTPNSVNGSSQPKQPLPPPDTRKLEELVLSQNPELREIYNELVVTGVVSHRAFWSKRQNLISNAYKSKQGLPTQSLADAPTNSHRTHYDVTPQMMAAIFKLHPAVHKAYIDNVPDKITAQEFWLAYFKSEFFHQDRMRGELLREKSGKVDFFKYHDRLQKQSIGSTSDLPVDPRVDLSATKEDHLSDYGNRPDPTMIPGKETSAREIRDRLHRHAAIVLHPEELNNPEAPLESPQISESDVKTLEKLDGTMSDGVKISDLEQPAEQHMLPLHLSDAAQYFASRTQAGSNAVSGGSHDGDQSTFVLAQLRNYQFDHRREIKPRPSHVFKHIFSDKSKKTPKDIQSFLGKDAEKQLMTLRGSILEVCRHFWATVPFRKSDLVKPKLLSHRSRMATALLDLQDRLNKFRSDIGAETLANLERHNRSLRSLDLLIRRTLEQA
eukprot:NODE_168_length_2015_cov_54.108051_g144_i0.p1 GENE.NODE_168_length_2015_cov_54.108051_g144_i0~~NODE_168_length_2015_cov_54.108051_g144_i0.p1  ORF type:complete len:582 (+),score=87.71 NODE_168_length_2015_cov_54.108051_g144_i0:102-1847(+)